jgi:hypothetical protein
MKAFHRAFLVSAGVILLITGIAKMWSGFGSARILAVADPLLGLQFGHLIFVAGALELVVANVCLFSKSSQAATILVAWLATNLLAYRLSFWLMGWHRQCSCLGNLTDALHIPPQTADTAMKIILAYLLIGSYGILFHLWWRKKENAE